MSNRHFRSLTAIFILLFIYSCEEKEYVIWEVNNDSFYSCNIGQSHEFFNNGDAIFTYTCTGDGRVEFFLDVLSDHTNGNDFYQIYIDRNGNGELDEGTDRMISNNPFGEICGVTLLSQTSTTECYYSTVIYGETNFSATENSSVDHFNAMVNMSIVHLTDTTLAKIHIKIWDDTTGWTSYPADSPLFQDSFELQF